MTARTTRTTIVFRQPATINGVDMVMRAGPCIIEIDEEQIPNLSVPSYRRAKTTILVTADTGVEVGRQAIVIVPRALRASLDSDSRNGNIGVSRRAQVCIR